MQKAGLHLSFKKSMTKSEMIELACSVLSPKPPKECTVSMPRSTTALSVSIDSMRPQDEDGADRNLSSVMACVWIVPGCKVTK